MRGTTWLLLGLVWVAMAAQGQTTGVRFQPLLDNGWVNVSTLDLPPGRQAWLYQNTHEVFWIAMGDGGVIFVGGSGNRTKLELRLGDTRFFHRYEVRSVSNETAANVRAVVVQVKRSSLLADACYCTDGVERAICGCGAPAHLPAMWATGMGKIMAGGATLAAGQSYERAVQRGPTLLVALTPVQLLDEAAEGAPGRIQLASGEAAWVNAGRHKWKNAGPGRARYITLEF